MANEQLWWLSFASVRFLGVVIVRADSLASAIAKTHALRINPGGDVLGIPMATDEARRVRPEDIGRLLTKKETERYSGGKTVREREKEGWTLRDDAPIEMAHESCQAALDATPSIGWGGSSDSSSSSSSDLDTTNSDTGSDFSGGGGDFGGGGASSDW
jgi:uncharacterized membrane protein YgcG